MEFVFRLKDSVVQYLSPTKRRRTIGPGTPSNDAREHSFLVPNSEPHGRKAQAAVLSRVNKKYLSPSDSRNPRKRTRGVYEDEDDGLSPDDSISQITPQGDDSEEVSEEGSEEGTDEDEEIDDDEDEEIEVEESEEVEVDGDEEMEVEGEEEELEEMEVEEEEEESEEDEIEMEVEEEEDLEEDEMEEMEVEEEEEDLEEDKIDLLAQEEASAEAKVQEYLARQAELALRREDVERAKAAGDWHPDEIFLFERLAMRSFEELIPAEWQVDFPTLPQILFTNDLEKTFVNFQCVSSYRGTFCLLVSLRVS